MASNGPKGAAAAGDETLSRRDVLALGLTAGFGVVAAGVPVVRYLSPLASAGSAASVALPLDDLALWQAVRVLVRGIPSYVVRTPDEIVACSGVCTHLGCVVKWNRTRRVYFCPCHGARFAPDGRVLGGPAPAPLTRHAVVISEGKFVVKPA
jgi:cytochrome b6-f complex iron-sulfur subunit